MIGLVVGFSVVSWNVGVGLLISGEGSLCGLCDSFVVSVIIRIKNIVSGSM